MRRSIRVFIITLTVFGLGLLSGCGDSKKKGDGHIISKPGPFGGPGGYIAPGGCVGCGGDFIPMIDALGVHHGPISSFEVGLSFFSQQPIPPGYELDFLNTYQGMVAVAGEMIVNNSVHAVCPLPPGYYQLGTAQVGQWMGNQTFSGLGVEAIHESGQYSVLLSFISNSVLYADVTPAQGWLGNYPFHVQQLVVVVSINGFPCNDATGYYLE